MKSLSVAIILFTSTVVSAAEVDDGWRNPLRVERKLFTVALHDGSCAEGVLLSLNERGILLHSAGTGDRSIPRSEIVPISEFRDTSIPQTFFSARSSWSDIKD